MQAYPHRRHPTLLTLPQELRDQIYTYLFQPTIRTVSSLISGSPHPLLSTCRQLRAEVRPVYFQNLTIAITDSKSNKEVKFLAPRLRTNPSAAAVLRKLIIQDFGAVEPAMKAVDVEWTSIARCCTALMELYVSVRFDDRIWKFVLSAGEEAGAIAFAGMKELDFLYEFNPKGLKKLLLKIVRSKSEASLSPSIQKGKFMVIMKGYLENGFRDVGGCVQVIVRWKLVD